MNAASGTLLAIWLRPGARVPPVAAARAQATARRGLEGDHAGTGKREVTLLSTAAWAAACRELGRELDPSVRRANLLVDGLDLATAIGSTIAIGDVRIEVLGETRPCELMDDGGRTGLMRALQKDRRGGVHGRILVGGELRVGDACRVLARAD